MTAWPTTDKAHAQLIFANTIRILLNTVLIFQLNYEHITDRFVILMIPDLFRVKMLLNFYKHPLSKLV